MNNTMRTNMKFYQIIILIALIFLTPGCYSNGILNLISTKDIGVGYGVCVENNFAYLTNNDGVVILDVSDPTEPEIIKEINSGQSMTISMENNLIYTSGGKGIVIFDINDINNPKKLGEYTLGGYIGKIKLVGSYLYVCHKNGLEILDVGNPTSITFVAHYGNIWMWGIEVADDIAYLASMKNGVELIDISSSETPKYISTLAETKGARSVHVCNGYLYVARHTSGVSIFDISDNKSPKLIGEYCEEDGGEARELWRKDNYLFVKEVSHIVVLDVTDLEHPVKLGEDGRGGGHDFFVYDKYIYAASGKRGLAIFQLNEKLINKLREK